MRKKKVKELRKVMEYYGCDDKRMLRKLKKTYNSGNHLTILK